VGLDIVTKKEILTCPKSNPSHKDQNINKNYISFIEIQSKMESPKTYSSVLMQTSASFSKKKTEKHI
jgi:hypothetical protein